MTLQATLSAEEGMQLRVVRNFDPKQMNHKEKTELKTELKNTLNNRRLLQIQCKNILTDEGLVGCTLAKEIGYQKQHELNEIDGLKKVIKMEELRKVMQKKLIIGKKRAMPTKFIMGKKQKKNKNSGSDESSPSEKVDPDGGELDQEDSEVDSQTAGLKHTGLQLGHRLMPFEWEDTVYPCSEALPLKKGDRVGIIPPADIGDKFEWWMVRHMGNGDTGFIPRNCVVIDNYQQPSKTTLHHLPMELLDLVLENVLHYWILNSGYQRNEDVIRALASVDFCWFQRIKRRTFKKRIWRQLKGFYWEFRKRAEIIRSNRQYLLENILPNDEFIASLVACNCITEVQRHIIQRHHSDRRKNTELFYIMNAFGETESSNFIKCLRRTNQKTVARILENGGGVIKVEVPTQGENYSTLMESIRLPRLDLQSRTKPFSYQTNKLISQLEVEGIKLLNSSLDRQTVIIWIWCQSQAAIEHCQMLYESNRLRDIFFENIQPLISRMIYIERSQFRKIVAVCPMSIDFTERIEVLENEHVYGVTKLRNEIYFLCRTFSVARHVIPVFEDRNPFSFQRNIQINKIRDPFDIRSSEKQNCLYICDCEGRCVWSITKETDGKNRIIKWLTVKYRPRALSVSGDGQLLVLSHPPSILMIYGPDASLIRSIQLPVDIEELQHAVETSIGNFIILHLWVKKDEQEESLPSGRKGVMNWVINEWTNDGQMVIRRFIPSNEKQKLNLPSYLSLDSDDRVFVADIGSERVILLDSDLKWNRIICPTKEETEETRNRDPWRLCYDEEKKQLIVGGFLRGFNLYTLSRF